MDIELLSKMIGELVLDHQEVGLPGLGTFISEFVPASFSDRGYTINPPYRRVTFVPGRAQDDSLVQLYAKSNDIDADQSKAILQHFLEGTKKVLMDRKTVVFPGLGRLRATRENNFFFITDETLDIYPDGFGLRPISLKNHEETPAELHHVVSSLADILVEPAEAAAPAEPAEAAAPVETAAPAEPAAPMEPVELQEEPVVRTEYAEPAITVKKPEYVAPSAALKRKEYSSPEAKLKRKEYARPKTKVRVHVNKWVWLAPLILVLLAVVALAVFMLLVHVAPDFIDSILYTPEELRIINY